MAVPQRIIDRAKTITNKKEFNSVINSIKVSDAPLEQREEAIRYIKTQCSKFDTQDKPLNTQLLKDIQEGEADIDDIG